MLLGLDWAKPMMFLMLHVTCSCISHAYVPSIISIFYIDLCLVLFCFSLSLSLSHVSCSIAPKQKSTPSRHHLCFVASSSSSPADSTPSHVRVYDDKARNDFRRTFPDMAFIRNSKSFDIHSKRQIIRHGIHLIILYLSLSLTFEVCAL